MTSTPAFPTSASPYASTSWSPPTSALIIGAGLAGLRTLGELRRQGFTGHVTMVGSEPVPPYDRPPLSKHLLDRTEPVWLTDDLGIDLADADDVVLGTSVESLALAPETGAPGARADASGDGTVPADPARYEARLSDGRTIRADVVIIACGATANSRPGWDGTHMLHTADDAARLRAALTPRESGHRPHLVCIGAGWIGAEVSGLAAAAGARVTVLEATLAPLSGSLGPEIGALTAGWYAEADVDLRTDALVTSLTPERILLSDGEVAGADAVLVAIGARPATDWLGGSVAGLVDLLPGGAIDVDSHMRLIAPDGSLVPGLSGMRAVGDCASRVSVRHGRVPGGHWDGALRGPEAAVASVLAPVDESVSAPDPAPYVFSTQFGRELVLYGQPNATDDVVLRGDPGCGPGAPGWAALFFAQPSPRGGGAGGDGATEGGTAGAKLPGRELTAILLVDRPRDVSAARKIFAAEHLPRLDADIAADVNAKLTAAVVG